MDVYVFKVKLGYDRRVWRRIEIQGDQTLHDLSYAILDAFDFEDFLHLYSFFMSGEVGDLSSEYVSPDYFEGSNLWQEEKRSADEVKVCSLGLKPRQRFLYLFDYGDDWRFEVQFMGRVDSKEGATYPRITDRRGDSPPQYPEDEGEGVAKTDCLLSYVAYKEGGRGNGPL